MNKQQFHKLLEILSFDQGFLWLKFVWNYKKKIKSFFVSYWRPVWTWSGSCRQNFLALTSATCVPKKVGEKTNKNGHKRDYAHPAIILPPHPLLPVNKFVI
jgi:hypothetical protein